MDFGHIDKIGKFLVKSHKVKVIILYLDAGKTDTWFVW